MSCVFCQIAQREAPAHVVKESDHCIAIVPLNIEVDGHLLVLPKQHHKGIEDMPYDALDELMRFVKEVCLDIKGMGRFEGFNILHASGRAAQQSVPHSHIHILPRSHNDGIDAWPGLPGGANIYQERVT